MSLLTPSESRAFQSFLDATTFPMDWSMQLEISHEHMPPARGTEALTKATKDLMSLDGDNWRFPSPGATLATSADTLAHPPFVHATKSIEESDRTRTETCSYDPSSSSSSSLTARLPPKRSPPPDAIPSNKRYRRASTSQGLADEAQALQPNRAALLSPSQKKANHIQSEQKRRANIRKGYDALCDTVPSLREACQAEEEQQLADGKPRSRRKGRGKANCDDGERVDGRAGPRSENVVLSKTIDYLHELLSEREAWMQRLQMARRALPANHPLLQSFPDTPPPLWERKWSGGERKGDDDDDDDDDD